MAKLKFTIEGDTTSSDVALTGTKAKLNQISSTAISASKQFIKYGGIVAGTATAILVATTKQSLGQIDQLAKTADQMGITTEALATFQHLGELTGVSNEKMNSSLERMVKRLGEASSGQGAAKKTLDDLNLSAKELIQLSPDEQYRKIASEIRELSTQSEKAAAVAAIFGREGVALLNTIEAGDEAFIAAAKDAELFGTAVSRIEAAQVEAANDSFERVQEVLRGVSRTITVQLAPILKVISDRFVEAARDSGGFSDTISTGMEMAVEAVSFLADVIRGLEVAWKIAEIAAMGFISLTITGLDELNKAGAQALNWLPGVDIQPSTALSEWAENSRQALMGANAELAELVDKPMPSANVKQFFDDVSKEAQKAAEDIAATKAIAAASPGDVVAVDEGPSKEELAAEKVVKANEVKYQRLREMAEEFQLSEEERELVRVEREQEQFDLDLEKMIERGITVDEATEIQRQARLDSEAIHQNNMLDIEKRTKKSQTILERVAGTERAAVLQNTMDGLAKISGGMGKKMFKLQKAHALATALVQIPATAIGAYKAMAGIPIIGPALGVAAAVAAVAAGAAQVATIKSQKGPQAHAGLDNNPEEQTMLIKRGEMVLDPGTSEEVRRSAKELASGGGERGISIGQLSIQTSMNPMDMTREDWIEVMSGPFASAMRFVVDSSVDLGMQVQEDSA